MNGNAPQPPGHARTPLPSVDIPPHGDPMPYAHVPPPVPESDRHEVDVLKRRKHFSWKKFGGEGFLVSVAVHILLLVAGLFWIVSKWSDPVTKPDETFASGAGGGAKGDKSKEFEHKIMQRQPMIVKTPSRIVSKSASASISLPNTPTTSTASFATGLSSGGMSKGAGGGTGGGEGTGIGIGKGGGRNFVSLFGSRGANALGLPGYFYDMKQTPKGLPTKYAGGDSVGAFKTEVLQSFVKSWDESRFEGKFFKAPDRLYASQFFIPKCGADAAPKAYGVAEKVSASRWVAWYRGIVTAPKSGKFRFLGIADDAMVVRWDRRLVLDSGCVIVTEGGAPNVAFINKSVLGVSECRNSKSGTGFRYGPWFETSKGRDYPVEILISEVPGGSFCAWLFMEEAGSTGKGDGKIFLFRMSSAPLPEGLVDDTGFNVDLDGKWLVWAVKQSRVSVR